MAAVAIRYPYRHDATMRGTHTRMNIPTRRPNGSPPIPMHTCRVPDDIWDAARDAATGRELTMNALINRLLHAYAHDAALRDAIQGE